MVSRCPRCGNGEFFDPSLPDPMCWDCRATEADVDRWVAMVGENGRSPARALLASIGDDRAAPALRRHLATVDDPSLLAALVGSLGWSGDRTDGVLLSGLLLHDDPWVRAAVRSSLAELGVPEAADVLASILDQVEDSEALHVVDCLTWLGDARAAGPLRHLLASSGETMIGGRFWLGLGLARVGGIDDRRALADSVVATLIAEPPPDGASAEAMRARRAARDRWGQYVIAVWPVAPGEVHETRARLAVLGGQHAGWLDAEVDAAANNWVVDRVGRQPLGPRTVPSLAMTQELSTVPPDDRWPPAKFGGQPNWRAEPAWPIGGDGLPLVFYGQLPLPGPDGKTAYVFLGGPHEWQPLGQGNAVVVQPGPPPHLPTRPLPVGPQLYESVSEETDRYRRRTRRLPVERFVRFQESADPESWEFADIDPELPSWDVHGDWNKVGGTPQWLQGPESPPGEGWTFAFQFSAGSAGDDRGDGAECYGWTRPDGTAAFGWQCH